MKKGNAVILIGPQGAGKSTLCEIATRLGYEVIRASDQLKKYYPELIDTINRGMLVDDPHTLAAVRRGLVESKSDKWILDGIPRTQNQGFGILNMLWDEFGLTGRVATISIKVPTRVSLERMLIVRKRSDDTPESARRRLRDFRKNTPGIIVHLMRYTTYYELDGALSQGDAGGAFSHTLNEERKRLAEYEGEQVFSSLQPQTA